MFDLFIEDGVENDKWSKRLRDSSRPASMFTAIVLKHADYDCLTGFDRLLPPTFGPIRQKLRLPLVSQRVVE